MTAAWMPFTTMRKGRREREKMLARQRLTLTDLPLKGAEWFQISHTIALSKYFTPAFVNMLCNRDHIYVFNNNNLFSQMWCEGCQCWDCLWAWNHTLSRNSLIQVNISYYITTDKIRLYLSINQSISIEFCFKLHLHSTYVQRKNWHMPGMGQRTRQWRSGWFCQLKPFWMI